MIYQDTEGKWLDYCPTSFWIKDNELYCSAKMDYATYEQWQEYTKSHKVELYVHSSFQYNEADGRLKTNAHIMTAEKAKPCLSYGVEWQQHGGYDNYPYGLLPLNLSSQQSLQSCRQSLAVFCCKNVGPRTCHIAGKGNAFI